MLRPGCDVEAVVGKGVIGMGNCVIGVAVVDDGMGDVDIKATEGVDDFGEAIQADPGVAINGDAVIFLDGQAGHAHAVIKVVAVRGSEEEGLVNFVHAPYIRHIHPRVTGDREQGNLVVDRVNVYDHHDLGEQSGKGGLAIVVAA